MARAVRLTATGTGLGVSAVPEPSR